MVKTLMFTNLFTHDALVEAIRARGSFNNPSTVGYQHVMMMERSKRPTPVLESDERANSIIEAWTDVLLKTAKRCRTVDEMNFVADIMDLVWKSLTKGMEDGQDLSTASIPMMQVPYEVKIKE